VVTAVLGIDLSLTSTGLALANFGTITWTAAVKTGPSGNAIDDRVLRLRDIRNQVESAVMRYLPDLAVIEAPSFGSAHGAAHERSGLWWLVADMLYLRHVTTVQISPKQRAMYGTGNGNADKKNVHAAVKATYGRPDLPIATNDEADAVLLAAMGSRWRGKPVESALPPRAELAMEKVAWPWT
jgi:crossover junction endodeoxyribonuclease RuvC